MASDAVGKKKKEKDGKEPESYDDINQERSKGETDFIDAHGKKDTVADGDDAIKLLQIVRRVINKVNTSNNKLRKVIRISSSLLKHQSKTKKSKTEKVKNLSPKSLTTLMDMALKALKGQTVPEMKQIIASSEKERKASF